MTTFKNTIKDYDKDPAERARAYAEENMGHKIPTVKVNNTPKNYYVGGMPINYGTNYTQERINAEKNGDPVGAMYNEQFHNAKDGYYGLGYGASGTYNYLDPKGYGGLMEAKYKEIEDHFNNGFDYNYQNDTQYQALRRLKEKEAEKAYNDGYAQLSRAFDGDIPVNMINKLLTTKSEVTDQADSYIPQLRQMAYDMYLGKGNALYNQYNMLGSKASEDYSRWLTDRNYITDGIYKNAELDRLYLNDAIKAQQEEAELQRKLEQDAIDNYYKEWDLRIKQQNADKRK